MSSSGASRWLWWLAAKITGRSRRAVEAVEARSRVGDRDGGRMTPSRRTTRAAGGAWPKPCRSRHPPGGLVDAGPRPRAGTVGADLREAGAGSWARPLTGARSPHVTSASRSGGLWRCVMVGSRPTTSVAISSASRIVEAGLKPSRRTARVAADEDHLHRGAAAVRAPVPHVERVDAVVGVARPVQVAVPLVLGEALLERLLDLDRVGRLGQHLLEEVDVARVVDRVELHGVTGASRSRTPPRARAARPGRG